MRYRAALTAATLLLAPITAPAASISVTPGRDGAAKVVVRGSLVAGDGSDFTSRTGTVGKAVVWLESDGGDVAAALAIGDTIARKGFATFVPGWALCSSGCALAWLAGSPRTMEPGAHIGFHTAYNPDTRQESAAGNARIDAYLTRLGLPKAVDYTTAAPADGMTWLDPGEAERYGITVYLADAQGPPAQPAVPRLPAAQVAKSEMANPVAAGQSRLPPCPFGSTESSWDSCAGSRTFPNGNKYVGEFRGGLPNGRGTTAFPNGDMYVGEFRDDTRNGQGTYTYANGDKYVGAWVDDKRKWTRLLHSCQWCHIRR